MSHEGELQRLLSDVPPVSQVYKIPLQNDLNGHSINGHLLACFETRIVERQFDAMMQVRFVPIIWNGADDETGTKFQQKLKQNREGWACSFELGVRKGLEKTVKFGPTGWIILEPKEVRGVGVATFAWKQLIEWAQTNYPDYDVADVTISAVDARYEEDPLNHLRRNRFYEKHGFVGKFNDAEKKSGKYIFDGKVRDLIRGACRDSWQQIDVVTAIEQYEKSIFAQTQEVKQLDEALERTNDWLYRAYTQIRHRNYWLAFSALFIAGLIYFISRQ